MGADRTVHVGAHNRRNGGYTNGEKRLGDEHMQFLWAFLVGGAICAVGQILIDLTKLTPARILTGFVVAGVILSAVGLYKPLAEFAGAGATVPIVGFGHLLYEGVVDAIAQNGASGIITGGITAAAGGIAMSLMMGLLVSLLFRSKDQS